MWLLFFCYLVDSSNHLPILCGTDIIFVMALVCYKHQLSVSSERRWIPLCMHQLKDIFWFSIRNGLDQEKKCFFLSLSSFGNFVFCGWQLSQSFLVFLFLCVCCTVDIVCCLFSWSELGWTAQVLCRCLIR
jgi:hypothetical protein